MGGPAEFLLETSSIVHVAGGETWYADGNVFVARKSLAKFARMRGRGSLCVLKYSRGSEITANGITAGRKKLGGNLNYRCTTEGITTEDIEEVRSVFKRVEELYRPAELKNMTIASTRPSSVSKKQFTQLHASPVLSPYGMDKIRSVVEVLYGAPVDVRVVQRSWMFVVDIPIECKVVRNTAEVPPGVPLIAKPPAGKFQLLLDLGTGVLYTSSIVISQQNSIHGTLILPSSIDFEKIAGRVKEQVIKAFMEAGVIQC